MTITSKFASRCRACGQPIAIGEQIEWSRQGGGRHITPAACTAARAKYANVPAVVADGRPIAAFIQGAKDRGLQFPKARFLAPGGGELTLSIAGDTSRYPGSIQVKRYRPGCGAEWIGRIEPDGTVSGGTLASETAILAAFVTIAADPAAAAKAYGALMGRCSFCDAPITDAGSVDVGYGPTCAKRWGLPHKSKGTPELKPVPDATRYTEASDLGWEPGTVPTAVDLEGDLFEYARSEGDGENEITRFHYVSPTTGRALVVFND